MNISIYVNLHLVDRKRHGRGPHVLKWAEPLLGSLKPKLGPIELDSSIWRPVFLSADSGLGVTVEAQNTHFLVLWPPRRGKKKIGRNIFQ